jgi:gliding motility-associated-like protein
VRDAIGLSSNTSVKVDNIPGPGITAVAQSASCLNNDGSVSITANGGTSPFLYSVNGGNFQSNPDFTGLGSGTVPAIVKDANGCQATQTVAVPLLDTLFAKAGNNITVCEGTSSSLNATSNGVSFAWHPGAGLDNPTILTPVASPAATTKYYLTAIQGVCSKTDSVMVFVNPSPTPDAGTDTTICFGKSVQLQGSGGVKYYWTPSTYLDNADIADPLVTQPPNSITYNLTVEDNNGCKSLQPASVHITITPAAKVFAGNDTSVVINQPLQLHAVDINNSGFTQYMWSPPTGLSNPADKNPTATITGDITYTVVASTPSGCEAIDDITIKGFLFSDIFVPNAFTPNNDGHNDILKAVPIGIKEFKYFVLYNRWGQRIFITDNPANGWTGVINGKLQDEGVYVWMAMGIDYKGNTIQRKGTVILIR